MKIKTRINKFRTDPVKYYASIEFVGDPVSVGHPNVLYAKKRLSRKQAKADLAEILAAFKE